MLNAITMKNLINISNNYHASEVLHRGLINKIIKKHNALTLTKRAYAIREKQYKDANFQN